MTRPAWVAPGGQLHPFNVPLDPTIGSPWYPGYKASLQYGLGVVDPFNTGGLEYGNRLWNYGASPVGNWNVRGVNFTYPLYYTEDADDTYTIVGGNSSINGTTIPFKSTWKSADPQLASISEVATGGPQRSDAQMIVVNQATGKEWDLWRVFVDVANKKVYINGGSVVGTEVDRSVPGNTTADIYTKTNGWIPSRGMGMPYLMGLVTPEEITALEITHALSMPSNSIAETFFLPPATKLEHPATTEPNTHPIPEGARFYLSILGTTINGVSGFSDPEEAMDAFIAWKHAARSAGIKAFIKTLGVAFFKYGWFITDTSQNAGWQCESTRSAGDLWTALGIDMTSSVIQNCMDGLIIPPTLDPVDGWIPGNIFMSTIPSRYLLAATQETNIAEEQLIWHQAQGLSA